MGENQLVILFIPVKSIAVLYQYMPPLPLPAENALQQKGAF